MTTPPDLPESFANHPRSITEIKSDKTLLAEDTTPRDALIETLREIDSGQLKPRHLIISYIYMNAEGTACTGYRCAGPNGIEGIGLLALTQMEIAGAR